MTLLEGDPWFAGLTAARRTAVLRDATIIDVRKGRPLYRIGDDGGAFYAILAGGVRLTARPAPGWEVTALVLEAGEWFGELSILDDHSRPHDAIAESDARLLVVSKANWRRLADSDPTLWAALAGLAARRHRQALAHMGRLLAQPPSVRLAGVLLELAGHGGMVRLSQDALASLVGVTRQTLNPLLRRLEERRLIQRQYACVTVEDRNGLLQLVKE